MADSVRWWLDFTAAHYLTPRPLAQFIYYATPTFQLHLDIVKRIYSAAPISENQIAHFIAEPVSSGTCPPNNAFDPDNLLHDLTENKEWIRPAEEETNALPRVALSRGFLQTNQYPELMKEVGRGLEDPAWKSDHKTILIHGDKDVDSPHECSELAVKIIGKCCLRELMW